MVDKAFLVGVDDLRELCEELEHYSLSVNGASVTITRHDSCDCLNDVSFDDLRLGKTSIVRAPAAKFGKSCATSVPPYLWHS